MTRSSRSILLLASLCILPACRGSEAKTAAAPPAKGGAPTERQRLMKETIDPAADVVWGAVSTTISAEGMVDKAPATAAEWATVRSNAVVLRDSGRLLLTDVFANPDPAWAAQANALVQSSEQAIKAAEAKDVERILAVGETINLSCAQCHLKFMAIPPR